MERRLIESALSVVMWWDQAGPAAETADIVDSVETAGDKVAETVVGAVEEVKEKVE